VVYVRVAKYVERRTYNNEQECTCLQAFEPAEASKFTPRHNDVLRVGMDLPCQRSNFQLRGKRSDRSKQHVSSSVPTLAGSEERVPRQASLRSSDHYRVAPAIFCSKEWRVDAPRGRLGFRGWRILRLWLRADDAPPPHTFHLHSLTALWYYFYERGLACLLCPRGVQCVT
jgi:hypothetical protein